MQLRKLVNLPGSLGRASSANGQSGANVNRGGGQPHRKAMRIALAAVVAVVAVALAVIGMAKPTAATAASTDQDVVVSGTTTWQYRDNNQAPADGWMTTVATTDTAWKDGIGSFGAKNGKIADLGGGYTPSVLLNQYTDDGNDIPVYYFRTTFDVSDPGSITGVTGQFVYDDAATIYINGVRVGGADDSSFDTNGYSGSNASAPQTATISFTDIASLNLKETGNVVAVELHNGRASSSDVYFDLTKLTLTTQDAQPADDIKDVEFAVGSNESQRNFNWLGTSTNTAYVEYVVKPDGYQDGDAFPEDAATKVQAYYSEESGREGYQTNKATITGIQGNTTYLYRVGNDDKWSDTYEFTTKAQGTGESFNFLFAGDPQIGAGGNVAGETEGWNNTLERALSQLGGANFIVSAGDQVNNSTNIAQFDGYYAPNALRSVPQATTVGNHDYSDWSYSDYNNMPNVSTLGSTWYYTGDQSGDYWYTYNGVLFMDLNSNNTSTSEHKQFMQQAIAANPNATWKIVVFHHSVFSLANHYTDTDVVQRRAELPAVFSELGIDAVLMGHDHYFTRTYMMDGETPDVPEGNDVSKGEPAPTEVVNPKSGEVVYLTANSASGSKYYKLNSEIAANGLPNYVATQDQSNRQSITNVTVTGDSLTLDTYYTSDATLEKMDTFTIKRTSPTISVPANSVQVKVGEKFDPLEGVSATDADGSDLTSAIQVSIADADGNAVDSIDTSKEGSYVVTYTVTDAAGYSGTATVQVQVVKDDPNANADNNNGTGSTDATNDTTGSGTTNGSTSNGSTGNGSTVVSNNSSSTTKPARSTTSGTTSGSTSASSPKMGDTISYGLIAALAAAGVGLAAVAAFLRRKGQGEDGQQ